MELKKNLSLFPASVGHAWLAQVIFITCQKQIGENRRHPSPIVFKFSHDCQLGSVILERCFHPWWIKWSPGKPLGTFPPEVMGKTHSTLSEVASLSQWWLLWQLQVSLYTQVSVWVPCLSLCPPLLLKGMAGEKKETHQNLNRNS